MRSTWDPDRLLIRGPLTDRKIDEYLRRGWYSAEVRQMRRERNEKRMARWQEREKRDGNFLKASDGRLIYAPT